MKFSKWNFQYEIFKIWLSESVALHHQAITWRFTTCAILAFIDLNILIKMNLNYIIFEINNCFHKKVLVTSRYCWHLDVVEISMMINFSDLGQILVKSWWNLFNVYDWSWAYKRHEQQWSRLIEWTIFEFEC